MKAVQHKTELYRLAYQCHEYKRKGCNGYCGNCQLNVSLYLDDAREAVLIKTGAALDNEKMAEYKREEDSKNIGQGIAALGIIAFIIFSINSCMQSCGQSYKTAEVKPRSSVTSPAIPEPAQTPEPAAKQYNAATQPRADMDEVQHPGKRIQPYTHLDVLYWVERNVYDSNSDGIINCIDYAVLFKQRYGKYCRIIQNNNPQTGMNHLFNAVPSYGSGWMYIEPQGDRYGRYMMVDVWGSKYDPYFNIDVTSKYARN